MSNEDIKIGIETEITSASSVLEKNKAEKEKLEIDTDVTMVMKEHGTDLDPATSTPASTTNITTTTTNAAVNDVNESKKEEKYRRSVTRAFENAREVLEKVKDGQGLDIYQYCAFLSKNAYHVAPKSKHLKQQQRGGEGGDGGGGDDDNDDNDDDNNEYGDYNNRDGAHHERKRSTLHSTDLIRKAVNRKYRVSKLMYYMGMAKALLVAGLQLISLLVAMTELINNHYDDGDTICDSVFQFQSAHQTVKKTLFAGFCALIAINVMGLVKDLGSSGLYSTLFRNECLVPDLIDQGWLIAGRTVNYLVLISSTWASFLIIFFSDDVLNMVINSVAIFFVLQLDNMVVGREHYKILANYLDVYEWDIQKRVDSHIRKKTNQETEEEKNARAKEWNIFKLLFDLITWILSTAIVTPAVFLTSFLAFVFVPAFILVCGQ